MRIRPKQKSGIQLPEKRCEKPYAHGPHEEDAFVCQGMKAHPNTMIGRNEELPPQDQPG